MSPNPQTAGRIAQQMADVLEQTGVEFTQAVVRIRIGRRLAFPHQIGVTAQRPLAEDDYVAGQDIGPFLRWNGQVTTQGLIPELHQIRQAPSSDTIQGPTGVRGVQALP